MNPQPINKDVTEDDLNLIYNSLEELNKELNNVGLEIFKNETDKKVLAKPSHYTFCNYSPSCQERVINC